MPDPFVFVRVLTAGLATAWTVIGLHHLWSTARQWEGRLAALGFEARWVRRQALRFVLRTTVLDPVNLALMLVLVTSWTLPWFLA